MVGLDVTFHVAAPQGPRLTFRASLRKKILGPSEHALSVERASASSSA